MDFMIFGDSTAFPQCIVFRVFLVWGVLRGSVIFGKIIVLVGSLRKRVTEP